VKSFISSTFKGFRLGIYAISPESPEANIGYLGYYCPSSMAITKIEPSTPATKKKGRVLLRQST